MNAIVIAVNAKYAHTSLAARYIKNTLEAHAHCCEIAEYTINQAPDEILQNLVGRVAALDQPAHFLFSCYIWNITVVNHIGSNLRKIFPDASIILGGPEVSYDAAWQLTQYPWANAIACGEAEPLIASIVQEDHPHGIYTPDRFADLDTLDFPYPDLSSLFDRVLYYESTRGCPFGCSYCLSSADRTVRTRSLPLVFADLKRFLDAQVMRVKFVDRTFNADAPRASAIWAYLIEQDNGVTGFQMEIGGDLLTPAQLALLEQSRPGLFQFEVGVQSTCPETLREICRATDLDKLFSNMRSLQTTGRIHLHLDLIAGLPCEGLERFAESYDAVFALQPAQLQLGFLKLLRGSRLWRMRAQYGLVHSDMPPYQVLYTPALSYTALGHLGIVERMTELYYNSERFHFTLAHALSFEPSAFSFFLELGKQMDSRKVGKYELYDILIAFCVNRGRDHTHLAWLARLDICCNERPRKLPLCCEGQDASVPRTLLEQHCPSGCYAQILPLSPAGNQVAAQKTLFVFDPRKRDFHGRNAYQCYEV